MPPACFPAGTTKNPIKRAIRLGTVSADKDSLGRWRIDERTFLSWVSRRQAAIKFKGVYRCDKPENRCKRLKAVSSFLKVELSNRIGDRRIQIEKAEQRAWEQAPEVQADVRSVYLAHLAMINGRNSF